MLSDVIHNTCTYDTETYFVSFDLLVIRTWITIKQSKPLCFNSIWNTSCLYITRQLTFSYSYRGQKYFYDIQAAVARYISIIGDGITWKNQNYINYSSCSVQWSTSNVLSSLIIYYRMGLSSTLSTIEGNGEQWLLLLTSPEWKCSLPPLIWDSSGLLRYKSFPVPNELLNISLILTLTFHSVITDNIFQIFTLWVFWTVNISTISVGHIFHTSQTV